MSIELDRPISQLANVPGSILTSCGAVGTVLVYFVWAKIDPERVIFIGGSPVWSGLLGSTLSLASLFVIFQGLAKMLIAASSKATSSPPVPSGWMRKLSTTLLTASYLSLFLIPLILCIGLPFFNTDIFLGRGG